ncbi:MAG: DMT family transporter [Anaerolineae bacterium]|jgi:drug/metabolite transporter (DMT)-like permease
MARANLDASDSDLRKGATIAVLSAISYSTAIIFVRYAYRAGISPGTAIFLRFTIASIVLVGFLILTRHWVKLPRSQVIALFLLGFLAYTTLGTTWFVALSTTPAWLVSLTVSIYPLLVSIGSWLFFGDVPDAPRIAALTLVLAGSMALFWRPFEGVALTGVWLMLFNVVVNAFYVLVGQRWTRGVAPGMSAAWMIMGAMVGTFFYALLSGQLSFQFESVGWIWASLFAVVSTVLAIMFLWWSIGLLGPARATIIGALEPFLSILLAVIILKETMSPLQVVGGVLILGGVVLVRINLKK